jgi:phage-related protein
MTTGILTINGRTLEQLGIELQDQGAVWAAPQVNRGASGVIGRIGERPSAAAVTPGRTITLTLPLPASPQTRRAALDRVLGHLDGLLVLEWSDAPGRVQYGRLERAEVAARFASVAWTLGHLSIPLQIRIDNPAWFDWQATTIANVANVDTPMPIGTLPVAPLLRVSQITTGNIVFEYKSITGASLSSLVITDPVLTSGQELYIDCGTDRIFRWTGSAFTQANNLYSSGSFPIIDPGDGQPEFGVFPTLRCNRPFLATYRKTFA